MRKTPVSAPSVVAVSSTMASRRLVSRPFRKGAALPQEHAITETMLAPMATWMSTPNSNVRMGTMKMPLAMPSTPPRALAPNAAAKSQRMVDAAMAAGSVPLAR